MPSGKSEDARWYFTGKNRDLCHLRENGHIIINGDDDKLSTVGTVHGIKPVHFGLDEKNEYYADEIESQGFRGISCRIHTPQGAFLH